MNVRISCVVLAKGWLPASSVFWFIHMPEFLSDLRLVEMRHLFYMFGGDLASLVRANKGREEPFHGYMG